MIRPRRSACVVYNSSDPQAATIAFARRTTHRRARTMDQQGAQKPIAAIANPSLFFVMVFITILGQIEDVVKS